jgi:lysophospholipase L1-like esterase
MPPNTVKWLIAALVLVCACGSDLAGPPDASDADADGDTAADADADADADTDADVDADADADVDADADGVADADIEADAGDAEIDSDPDADIDGDGDRLTAAECFDGVFADTSDIVLDYDRFGPVIGSHCLGTNHQDIEGVERVVFLGDSVTVGTPPTTREQFYRSRLAEELSWHFGLAPPGELWEMVNWLEGTSMARFGGDFACCAKWGARTDDLVRDNTQIEDCFPPEERSKRTLVIMTVGGNDIASITQDGIDGVPVDTIWEDTREFVQLMREAVQYFYEDPERFPGGVYVIFANMFEFTDGTGDVTACPAAGLAGFGAEWDDPDALAEMVIWANEQFMSIAVETGTDMVFMLEHFCGHGFNADDPSAPCYRGPGAETWFDISCIHPNPTGHREIADLFMAVVRE